MFFDRSIRGDIRRRGVEWSVAPPTIHCHNVSHARALALSSIPTPLRWNVEWSALAIFENTFSRREVCRIFLPLPFSLRRPRFESKGLPFVSIPRFMVISLQRDFFHIRGSRALCFQDILILADARGIYRTRYVTTSIKNNGSLD